MSYQPSFPKKIFHRIRESAARLWLSIQRAEIIGITGSQGKTNTTRLIYEILRKSAPTEVTDINLDTIYNVPITALHVKPWTRYAVFELGVDHRGEMDSYLSIVNPDVAIVTGISPVHADQEHLGSLENIITEKRKLIEKLPPSGYAILNYDDDNVRAMSAYTKAQVIYYGTSKGADIRGDKITVSLSGTQITIHDKEKKLSLHTPLIGKHHVYTLLAAYALCKVMHIDNNFFVDAVYKITPLAGRMSVEPGPGESVVLNDSLRANPVSTQAGLETLSSIVHSGQKIAILGEMGELGDYEIEEHRKIGRFVAKCRIDYFVSIGPLQKYTYQSAREAGFPKDKVFWAKNPIEAAEIVRKIMIKGDLLYLKGSVLRHVERVIHVLNRVGVGCNVAVCPFYHSCLVCPYLEKGYPQISS